MVFTQVLISVNRFLNKYTNNLPLFLIVYIKTFGIAVLR